MSILVYKNTCFSTKENSKQSFVFELLRHQISAHSNAHASVYELRARLREIFMKFVGK
jgi:hypothetical protein